LVLGYYKQRIMQNLYIPYLEDRRFEWQLRYPLLLQWIVFVFLCLSYVCTEFFGWAKPCPTMSANYTVHFPQGTPTIFTEIFRSFHVIVTRNFRMVHRQGYSLFWRLLGVVNRPTKKEYMATGTADVALILFRVQFIYKKNYPCNKKWKPIGLWDVEAPTAHRWQWGCQPYASATR
jgi:hypothetical protein